MICNDWIACDFNSEVPGVGFGSFEPPPPPPLQGSDVACAVGHHTQCPSVRGQASQTIACNTCAHFWAFGSLNSTFTASNPTDPPKHPLGPKARPCVVVNESRELRVLQGCNIPLASFAGSYALRMVSAAKGRYQHWDSTWCIVSSVRSPRKPRLDDPLRPKTAASCVTPRPRARYFGPRILAVVQCSALH